jgi:hypothetical protein
MKAPPARRTLLSGSCRISCTSLPSLPYLPLLTTPGIRGCKISLARCGGVTHWALTPDEDDTVMTVAWGQNAANGVSPTSFQVPNLIQTYRRTGAWPGRAQECDQADEEHAFGWYRGVRVRHIHFIPLPCSDLFPT